MQDIDIKKIKAFLKDPLMRKYVIGGAAAILALVYTVIFTLPSANNFFSSSSELEDIQSKVYLTEKRIKRIPAMKEKKAEILGELKKH